MQEAEQRWLLAQVFVVAATVIGLEIIGFQQLCFVNEYLPATRVLSVALLGLALGGLLSWFVRAESRDRVLSAVLWVLPLAVLSSFVVIARLSHLPVLMMALLTAPYVLAALVIALAFDRLEPRAVYLWDLLGAGAGCVVVVLGVPWLREEGTFALLTALAGTAALLDGLRHRHRPRWLVGGLWVAVGSGLVLAHLAWDPFNLMHLARAEDEAYALKVFNRMERADGEPRYVLEHSRGSLIERIDIVRRPEQSVERVSVYNGRSVDVLRNNVLKRKRVLDTRMPTRLELREDPDTLLVGPSGQGLTKTVRSLGDGRVDAVELNGAIAGLMREGGPLWRRSGRAYQGLHLTIGDVRTFLARTERRYDWITLLNTHRVWGVGHLGPPEYVHTVEAIGDYLDHLTEGGLILFEERNTGERAALGTQRILRTAMAALAERGAEDPASHIAVWEYLRGCTRNVALTAPERCSPYGRFVFAVIKGSPLTEAEQDHLGDTWSELLAARKPTDNAPYRGIVWHHLPQAPSEDPWSEVLRADAIYDVEGLAEETHNLGTITDDRPFPYDVFTDRTEIRRVVLETTGLACGLVLLPTGLAFGLRRRERPRVARGAVRRQVALGLFFAVLGCGYLTVEIVLIQKLGIFLSSPVLSLAVVLATMLVASGLGGLASAGRSRGWVLKALVGVVIGAALLALGLAPLLEALMGPPLLARILIAIAVLTPLAFGMGVPFPYGLALAKRTLSERHAGAFFGVNGALAAIATPLALWAAMAMGFDATLGIGAGFYALSAVLLWAAGDDP